MGGIQTIFCGFFGRKNNIIETGRAIGDYYAQFEEGLIQRPTNKSPGFSF